MARTLSLGTTTNLRDEASRKLTRALLTCGVIAGTFFILVGAIELAIRPGFDIRVNVLSQMSLGDLGWIQVANFLVSGLLVLACAVGLRRVLAPGRGATWGPILVGLYGAGLFVAAFFSADPGFGFPPGAPAGAPSTLSDHGFVHFLASGMAFVGLIAACFVFARRFRSLGQRAWSTYSLVTGIIFLGGYLAVMIEAGQVGFALPLWIAITLAWIWLSALAASLLVADVDGAP